MNDSWHLSSHPWVLRVWGMEEEVLYDNDMIYDIFLLTAIRLTPCGSSIVVSESCMRRL
jgi:hypothetical protein